MESCTAFVGGRRIASGPIGTVAPQVKSAYDSGAAELLVFDDLTGRLVELDLRGSVTDVLTRLPAPQGAPGRGRPKLGVTAREVTLLPSHWDWLAAQPGGASGTLRRLVDAARRSDADARRESKEAAYRVMFALGGNLPNFEEASRAFYANDLQRLESLISHWASDVRDYVLTHVERALSADEAD